MKSTISPVPLESILRTEELNRRAPRQPDYASENVALVALTRSLANSPDTILQTLAESILDVLKAGSAGVSLLTENEERFYWPAIAGLWQAHIGGGTPRNFGPCGDVLDCNAPLLLAHVERRYAYFEPVTPPVEECLLVPFYVAGKAVGTIWAVAHDVLRKFDSEDLRQLENLGLFASAAYQAQTMAGRDQRHAALKLEDALQTSHALEQHNAQLLLSANALRRSEAELRDFVENASVGLQWVGPDGSVLWANQTELDLLGYTREEYIGHNITEFYADRAVIEDMLVRLTGGETLHDHEARMRCKDGSIRHVVVSSNAYVEDGKFGHTRCFTRDITARKQAEAALKASEDRVGRALDAAQLGTFNIDIATNTLITDKRFLAIFGTTSERIGYDGAFATVHPDDRQQQRDAVAAATRSDNPAPYNEEYRVVHPDGTLRWVFAKGRANFAEQGTVRRLVSLDGTVADITDRKRAEESLRASEEFNRSIIDSSPDCIKVLDLEGNLLSMLSGQALLGIEDIRPFLNKSWVDFWEGVDRQAAQAAVTLAAAGTEGHFDGFFRTGSGESKWWDVAITPILDANGKPERLLSVSRDVTQRRRAELNLAFLAGVSHDLVLWTNVDEMMRIVGAKIAAHFKLSLCAFVEIDEAADQAVIHHDWHRDDVPSLIGVHRLGDFVGEEFTRLARAGKTIVVRNTGDDARTSHETFNALKIGAFICEPLIRDEQWRFALCLYHSAPYDWRQDEIELTRELTARIWTRLERLRAEEALRGNEWRLRNAMDSARLTFVEVDLERGGARTADNFAAVMGYASPPEQEADVSVGTRLLLEHIVPHDRLRVQAALDEFIGGKPVGRIDYQVLGDDQIVRWIESRWSISLETDGRPLKSFATNFDVTERKHAEEALRTSEQRYRNLFNSMDQGYCIIELIFDQHQKPVDWLYLDVNPAFEKLSTMHGAVGKRIREMVPDLEQYWFDGYGNVALTGEPIRFLNEAKPLDRWFDVYAFRLGGPGTKKIAVLFTDITERTKTEDALRQSEARFRALFDRGPIGMYSCDLSGKTIAYNRVAVELWGLEPKPGESDEQLRGSFQLFLTDGTPLPIADTPMTQVLQGKVSAVHDQQIMFARPDGSRITVVANIVPLKNERGEITGAIDCFYDITERSLLEKKTFEQAEALTDLHRRKDEFLAMLSHELRNPLAPISNAVHLLRLQKNEDPIQQQARSIIERQVGQLTHLIDDLMEVSRITTGRIHLLQENIALSGVLENAVETVRPLIDKHRHSLKLSLPPAPIWLHADAARLEQVVVNLLTNAVKYTDKGGTIALSLVQDEDEAVIRVRDTGVGISAELLPRIFDLFTQADRSLDRSQGGLGIGLCLVKRLVEMHRGTVTAQSTLGNGSEFEVRLPVVKNSAFLPALATTIPLTTGEMLRVLIVEDNLDAAETLTMLLEMSGHGVRAANDGLAALQAALEYRPHVVLLDIGLPGMDGFAIARQLRAQPALANVVLVAMTGYGEVVARQRSREAGFDHHLVKPADFGKVQEILASVSNTAVLTH